MVEVIGRGGQARVDQAAGMSRNTLIVGAREMLEGPVLQVRVRRVITVRTRPSNQWLETDFHHPTIRYDDRMHHSKENELPRPLREKPLVHRWKLFFTPGDVIVVIS